MLQYVQWVVWCDCVNRLLLKLSFSCFSLACLRILVIYVDRNDIHVVPYAEQDYIYAN